MPHLNWHGSRVGLLRAVRDARVFAAVTAVVVALWFVVLAVAGAISKPHIDAVELKRYWVCRDDNFINDKTVIVTVVNYWSLREV